MNVKFILLAFICGSQATAQGKFIEVTVSDTVWAKADLFIYKIVLSPEESFPELSESRKSRSSTDDLYEQRQSKIRTTFDSLKTALKAGGFVLNKPSLGDSININLGGSSNYSATIITHSVDSLAMLYRQLKGKKGLLGFIDLEVAAHDSIYQEKLFKKILEQARRKAESIAVYSHQKVKGVQTVTENKAGFANGSWSSYSALSEFNMIPGWHTSVGANPNFSMTDPATIGWYPLAGTFTVRFWVE